MAYEFKTLKDVRKWVEQKEKDEEIKYFDNISLMELPNDGELPDYDKLAERMCGEFNETADIMDKMLDKVLNEGSK